MELFASQVNEPLSNARIKKELLEIGTIYIKPFEFKNETIEELILLFGGLSFKHNTYSSDGDLQCKASKKRSFSDLYRFIVHYRPNATVRTVKEKVAKLIMENKILPGFCPQIDKSILLYPGIHTGAQIPPNSYKARFDYKTEFGMNTKTFYNLT